MSTQKKPAKPNMEDAQAALQALINQGKKEGMIRATDLNAILEKMTLTPENIEEIYDRIDAMNIQLVTAELELDLGSDGDLDMEGDIDLSGIDEEDLVDPVDLAAEYSLDDPVRMYLKEIGRSSCCLRMRKWSWPSGSPRVTSMPRTSSPRPISDWWSPLPRSIPAGVCTFWI